MSNNYFTITEQYRERFYQLPKIFFTNENYKKMSNDAKISYAILKDRLDLSIKNNWVDNDGNIYFIYTVNELENILNCGNKKVAKIKKELENNNLLKQKRQGLNKPNLLYLLKPVITKQDIYEVDSFENNAEASNDGEVSKGHVQKCQKDTSRSVKRTRQEVLKEHTNDTELNDTELNDTEITTTTENSSGGIHHNDLIKKIKNELGIKITPAYKTELFKLFSYFDDDVINHAIEHTSINATSPKQFLLKILNNWKDANIKTLEQAQNYKVRSNKNNIVNFSREKTPKWLHEREDENTSKEMTEEEKAKFEKEREAFRKELEENWGKN